MITSLSKLMAIGSLVMSSHTLFSAIKWSMTEFCYRQVHRLYFKTTQLAEMDVHALQGYIWQAVHFVYAVS